jgi:HD-GYP domain-containing protein (c-di-GMP phosphodiesterase class II)
MESYFAAPDGVVARTMAVAPLVAGDGVSGWIAVRHPGDDGYDFTEERMRLLASLSYQASVALHKAFLYKAQKESAEIANSLLDFGRELAVAQELDEVLTQTVDLAARILGSPQTAVWLQERETGDLVPEALWGFSDLQRAELSNVRFSSSDARRFLKADPYTIRREDLEGVEGIQALASGEMLAVAPLKLDGGRMGALTVAAPAFGDYDFSDRKMRLVAGVAHQAKLAINNALSFENLERTFLETVEALANALEAKDEYTSDHARSITDMALEVGYALDLDVKTIKRLELGALFHDIGKIGIPSEILLKPGPLTDEERAVMETHPELGERILAPIDRLEDVRPIVRHCHEHYDGSGYPDRKVGEEIPIESRVILVCDAFHAMTTDRPYRKRLSADEAFSRLERSSGKQFDPKIVDAFIRLQRERGHQKEEAVA